MEMKIKIPYSGKEHLIEIKYNFNYGVISGNIFDEENEYFGNFKMSFCNDDVHVMIPRDIRIKNNIKHDDLRNIELIIFTGLYNFIKEHRSNMIKVTSQSNAVSDTLRTSDLFPKNINPEHEKIVGRFIFKYSINNEYYEGDLFKGGKVHAHVEWKKGDVFPIISFNNDGNFVAICEDSPLSREFWNIFPDTFNIPEEMNKTVLKVKTLVPIRYSLNGNPCFVSIEKVGKIGYKAYVFNYNILSGTIVLVEQYPIQNGTIKGGEPELTKEILKLI